MRGKLEIKVPRSETFVENSFFWRVAFGLSIVVSLFVLIAMIVFFFRDYINDRSVVESDTQDLVELAAFNLDNADYSGLEAIASIYEHSDLIGAIAIEDRFGFPVFGSRVSISSSSDDKYTKVFSLFGGTAEKVGTLWVVSNVTTYGIIRNAALISIAAFGLVLTLSTLFLRIYFAYFVNPTLRKVSQAIGETRRLGAPITVESGPSAMLGKLINDFNMMQSELREASESLRAERSEKVQRFSLLAEAMHLAGVYVSLFRGDFALSYTSVDGAEDPFLYAILSSFSPNPRAMLAHQASVGGVGRIIESTHSNRDHGVMYWIEAAEDRGTNRQFHLQALKFTGGDYALICVDLTNVKRLESKLRHSEKMQAVATLTSGVAHEFNNVLAVIQGRIELLLMTDQVPGSPVHQFNRLIEICETARQTTQELLQFSRNDTKAGRGVTTSRRLWSGFRDLLSSDERVKARVQWDTQLPSRTLHIDFGPIQRALLNLVKNALDATEPNGQVMVRMDDCSDTDVLCYGLSDRIEYIAIQVLDDGKGVPEENRSRLFEPFYSTKELGRGTGLGLWTAYQAAELAGGAVRFAPNKPRGSIFTLILPVQQDPNGIGNTPQKTPTAFRSSLSGKKVFVLEGGRELLEILADFLNVLDCRVVSSGTIADAERVWAEQSDFDFAVCNAKLPDGNGSDFAVTIRKLRPACKIVFLSGNPSLLSTTMDADAVLDKPIRLDILAKTLSDLLGHREWQPKKIGEQD